MGTKKRVKQYAGRRKPEVLPNPTLERTHTRGQVSVMGGEDLSSVHKQEDTPKSSPTVG